MDDKLEGVGVGTAVEAVGAGTLDADELVGSRLGKDGPGGLGVAVEHGTVEAERDGALLASHGAGEQLVAVELVLALGGELGPIQLSVVTSG